MKGDQHYVLPKMGELAWVLLRLMAIPEASVTLDKVSRGAPLDEFTKKELRHLYLWLDELNTAVFGAVSTTTFDPPGWQKARQANIEEFGKQMSTLRNRLNFAISEGIGLDD